MYQVVLGSFQFFSLDVYSFFNFFLDLIFVLETLEERPGKSPGLRCTGIVEQSVKELITFGGFKGGRGFGAHNLLPKRSL